MKPELSPFIASILLLALAPALLAAPISGSQEVPPNDSPMSGSVNCSVDLEHDTISYTVEWSLSSSGLLGVTFDSGKAGEVGTPIFQVPNATGSVIGPGYAHAENYPVSSDEAYSLAHEPLYVNIHTEDYPQGEIRGQVACKVSGLGGLYYISPAGDDSAECTREEPCASVASTIDRFASGDSITIVALPGTYAVTESVTMSGSIVSDPEMASPAVFDISALGDEPFLRHNSSTLLLGGINIKNGASAIVSIDGHLQLNRMVFTEVDTPVRVFSARSLTIDGCGFDESAQLALDVDGASKLDIVSSVFSSPVFIQDATGTIDTVNFGAGLKVENDERSPVSVTITSCNFNSVSATFSLSYSLLDVIDSVFTEAGMIADLQESAVSASGNSFLQTNGTAFAASGPQSVVKVSDSTFTECVQAIHVTGNERSTVSLRNLGISSATGSTGAVELMNVRASLESIEIRGSQNSAHLVLRNAQASLHGSTLTEGLASAIHLSGANTLLNVSETTVTENKGSKTNKHGGIFCDGPGRPRVWLNMGATVDSNDRDGIHENDCSACDFAQTAAEEAACPVAADGVTFYVSPLLGSSESYCGGTLVPCDELYHVAAILKDADIKPASTQVVIAASNATLTPQQTAVFTSSVALVCADDLLSSNNSSSNNTASPSVRPSCLVDTSGLVGSSWAVVTGAGIQVEDLTFFNGYAGREPLINVWAGHSRVTLQGTHFLLTGQPALFASSFRMLRIRDCHFDQASTEGEVDLITAEDGEVILLSDTTFDGLRLTAESSAVTVRDTSIMSVSAVTFRDSQALHLLSFSQDPDHNATSQLTVDFLEATDSQGYADASVLSIDMPTAAISLGDLLVNGTQAMRAINIAGGSSITLEDSHFESCLPSAVALQMMDAFLVKKCSFLGNGDFKGGDGGALSIDTPTDTYANPSVSITGSTFSHNLASKGGHISVQGDADTQVSVNVEDCHLSDGTAAHGGGAFFFDYATVVISTDTLFEKDIAYGGAQVIACQRSRVDLGANSPLKDGDLECDHKCVFLGTNPCKSGGDGSGTNPTPKPPHAPLEGWKIVLIVLGVLVGVSLLVLIVFFVSRNRNKQTRYVALVNDSSDADMTSYADSPWEEGGTTVTIED